MCHGSGTARGAAMNRVKACLWGAHGKFGLSVCEVSPCASF